MTSHASLFYVQFKPYVMRVAIISMQVKLWQVILHNLYLINYSHKIKYRLMVLRKSNAPISCAFFRFYHFLMKELSQEQQQPEAVVRMCSIQKVFLKISQNSWHGKTPAITHKIFETNSRFSVKQHTTGKLELLFFATFLLLSTKFPFSQGDWALGYYSIKFRQIPFIS